MKSEWEVNLLLIGFHSRSNDQQTVDASGHEVLACDLLMYKETSALVAHLYITPI